MAHHRSRLSFTHPGIPMMGTGDDADDLSMIDFFDAEDLLKDEQIQLKVAPERHQHQTEPALRRASIEFARELWSPSESDMDESDPSSPSDETAQELSMSFGDFAPAHDDAPCPSLDSSRGSDFNSSSIGRSDGSINSANGGGGFDPQRYNELLVKLTESMKRSEKSRAEVLRHRARASSAPPCVVSSSSGGAMMMPQQSSPSVSSALQRSSMTSPSMPLCSSPAPTPTPTPTLPPMPMPTPTSQTAATMTAGGAPQPYPRALSSFLNGSRSTLTSGLEQSRRQLAAYMNQVIQQSM